MKKYYKYILWIVAFYFFTYLLLFIAFNSDYKPIQLREKEPEQILIDKAEATKKQGRIYGNVQNNEQNNLNGKSIIAKMYDKDNKLITTEYVKIENLSSNEKKAFEINFKGKDIVSYEINFTK